MCVPNFKAIPPIVVLDFLLKASNANLQVALAMGFIM